MSVVEPRGDLVSGTSPTVSIVVATYRREAVLLDTVRALLALSPRATEIVLVDQTPLHEPATDAALQRWESAGAIRRFRQSRPSIPAAMNLGLRAAIGDIVLFVDDDIEPSSGLVGAHAAAHERGDVELVAGQVLQPGESPAPLVAREFTFRSTIAQPVDAFMGGNFSIARTFALSIGGFDENFVGAAYRFEAELAARVRRARGRIAFDPAASIRHLRAEEGGTRAWGNHLRTSRPFHAVGEYYFLLKVRAPGRWRRALARLWRSVRTRHHLRRPWWIPVTLLAELGGATLALALWARGERLLGTAPPARNEAR